MIICKNCGKSQTPDNFSSYKSKTSGFKYLCKKCSKEYAMKHYYLNHNKRKLQIKSYYELNKGALNKRRKEQKLKHPKKVKARELLKREVKAKRIIRLPCEKCGDEKSFGHHSNYNKPLDVIWLCYKHHGELHRSKRAEKITNPSPKP